MKALAALCLGASSLLWATPALAIQLAVSLLEPKDATVQLRLRISAGVEPVLNWTGTAMPTPYRLDLTWNDTNVTLERPLPALPSEGMGALQTIVLHSTPEQSRLELQLSEAVQPRLLRVGDSWV
jgi:hypothetical protein